MTAIKNHLWTVEEYHRMIETGILTADDKVELLNGQIIQVSPQRPPHAATTQRASDYLKTILIENAHVRTQLPITLSTSEPEPDIAIVTINPGEYGDHHPNPGEILLLIEVAYSTLNIDSEQKALIYAKANISDYWILDVVERQVYIFRQPTESGYQEKTIFQQDAAIAPLAFPNIKIPFVELFLP